MAEAFREDLAYAVRLLNNILADGNQEELQILLRQLTKAFRGMSKVDDQARFGRRSTDLMPSANANLEIRSLQTVLKMMGFRLVVQSIKQRH
ncbi:addiction module antidote protein [Hydrogenophaga sp.]|uniref:helix-turn-helix domain-containing transcriptional regulator n=1 Tax=Hydrogenophaga sp. TaxID=1904254 RepID=UPI00262DFB67|nr:addiction module antidote protein [Hydrogenophaga sp.]